MKILFDQGTPVPLRRSLTGHTVDTAYERGWSALTNGDLLAIAERDGYQVMITTIVNHWGILMLTYVCLGTNHSSPNS
jgi:hypothetical protein